MAREFDFSLLKKQTVNYQQIEVTIHKAYKSVEASRKVLGTDTNSSFILAYEAMLKATLALMLSRGYRPRTALGHHKTLVDFSSFVLGEKFEGITAAYDSMRAKRNKVVYDIALVSEDEASQATILAGQYVDIIKNKIEEDNPQPRLL